MEQKHYNIILFIGFVGVILFFVIFRVINKSVENQINTQIQDIDVASLPVQKPAPPAPVRKEKQQKRSLNADNPEDYHITPQRRSRLFKNQRYWDVITKRAVEQSDVIERMEEGRIFKGVQMTPAQFEKQLQRIDGRIQEYKRTVHNDPNNEYARRKLQSLYMLKSTVGALEEAVVTGDR